MFKSFFASNHFCSYFQEGTLEKNAVAYLESLELEDLLNVAKKNSTLAVEIFQRKFADKKFIIYNKSWYKIPTLVGNSFKSLRNWYSSKREEIDDEAVAAAEYDNTIEIDDYSTALKILKIFGQFISKIDLRLQEANSYQGKEISKHVETYCSESLREVHLFSESGSSLKYWKKPFVNVERLYFDKVSVDDLTKKNMFYQRNAPAMNETFPALRRLHIKSFVDSEYLGSHFSQLEHVEITGGIHGVEKYTIYKLIDANPQIRSVSLFNDCHGFLKMISSVLRNVENLSMHCPKDMFQYSEIVHFDSLKSLAVQYVTVPTNLRLPNLQKIQIQRIDRDHINEWIQFFNTNNGISEVIVNNAQINDDEFNSLTENLENLTEFSISLEIKKQGFFRKNNDFLSSSVLDRFLSSHPLLQNFQFDYGTEKDNLFLREKYQNEWQIDDNGKGLSFRKIE